MKMQTFLSATAFCALTAVTLGPAAAADIRVPIYRGAEPVVFNWTGFYVGVNIGESKDSSETTDTWVWNYLYPPNTIVQSNAGPGPITLGPQTTKQAATYRHSSMGVIGGLQWGYNWQVGGLLVGVEGDWMWSNEKNTFVTSVNPIQEVFFTPVTAVNGSATTQGWTSEQTIDWLTTWRARLGWAHESYLWYVTGGVAWAKVGSNYTLTSTPGLNIFSPTAINPGGQVWGLSGGSAVAGFETRKTG